MPIFFVFGAHAFIWGTTSVTVRQRAVPTTFRDGSAASTWWASFGGLVVGSALGGVLAQQFGVTAPFWFAFAGSAVFLVLIWGQLAHIAHDDADPGPARSLLPLAVPESDRYVDSLTLGKADAFTSRRAGPILSASLW